MKNAKFKPGEPIRSLDDLAKQDFVYWNGKIYHSGWFMSWQFQFVCMSLNAGTIFSAIKNEKEDEDGRECVSAINKKTHWTKGDRI